VQVVKVVGVGDLGQSSGVSGAYQSRRGAGLPWKEAAGEEEKDPKEEAPRAGGAPWHPCRRRCAGRAPQAAAPLPEAPRDLHWEREPWAPLLPSSSLLPSFPSPHSPHSLRLSPLAPPSHSLRSRRPPPLPQASAGPTLTASAGCPRCTRGPPGTAAVTEPHIQNQVQGGTGKTQAGKGSHSERCPRQDASTKLM